MNMGDGLAAGLGFEPRLPDPESGVLPLDDPASEVRDIIEQETEKRNLE